jgi:hypothetical protein
MLKKILIAFAACVALVLVVGLVLPSTYRVERSTTIQAPAEAVYAQVAHLERWQDWAPWNARKYPGNQWMFGGPAVGVGAVRSWSGEDVGTGTLSLTEADPKTGVAYEMSLKDGRYRLHGRISFEPEADGTRVTWVDEGDLGGGLLLHYLRFPLQSRLGGQLEVALAQLKKRVEAGPRPVDTTPEPEPAPAEAAAPPRESAPAAAPAAPTEGSSPTAPSTEGSQVATPTGAAPTGAAPVPSAEPTQAAPGTSAPTGESAPVEAPSSPPASEPTPAPSSAPADAHATPPAP